MADGGCEVPVILCAQQKLVLFKHTGSLIILGRLAHAVTHIAGQFVMLEACCGNHVLLQWQCYLTYQETFLEWLCTKRIKVQVRDVASKPAILQNQPFQA